MPKELMPIIDKPLIQYAAEEAVRAGIDTLIFVTGRHKRAIEDHFDSNPELESALRAKGKHEQADMVRNILPNGVECVFVRQSEQLGLGHAVLCAERVVGEEPFAVILADDFILAHGNGATADLVTAFEKTGKTQLCVMKVEGQNISKYGVVVPTNEPGLIAGIVEKPKYEHAPSNLASIGRYVLTPRIFGVLNKLSPGAGGEIQLADAINEQAAYERVEAIRLNGLRYDCGSVSGYLEATLAVADLLKSNKKISHPEI
jgi:UTP--glucose-1-phosphate uridylyltransferase